MPDLIFLVPTRGRPQAAKELAEAFRDTCAADTALIFVVDKDDPEQGEYNTNDVRVNHAGLHLVSSTGMVQALNYAATMQASRDDPHAPFAIGFMGDDHRPRTVGWDQEYLDALRELGTGIVYGNDLYQGEKIPTQCAMTADIVRALGYMAPPTLRHMYVDNYWADLAANADCLVYLPDVVVEHMHPVVGKAEWDEGYRRVNDPSVYDADALAYGEHHTFGRFDADVAKVRALRGDR